MKNKFLFFVLFIFAFSFATNADINMDGPGGITHFNTNVKVVSNYRLVFVSGYLVEGNPNNLESGDKVCPGSVVRVEPTIDAKWAVDSLELSSGIQLPGTRIDCATNQVIDDPYGPTWYLEDFDGSFTRNRDISWRSEEDVNNYLVSSSLPLTGCGYEVVYDDLDSGLTTEPVLYNVSSRTVYENKKGKAGLFCSGKSDILFDNTVLNTYELDSSLSPTTITLSSLGTHRISENVYGVNCFGAIVRDPPLDYGNNFFSAEIFKPSGFHISDITTKSIEVVDADIPCGLSVVSSTYYGPLQGNIIGNPYEVDVIVRNSGQFPMKVTSAEVSSGYGIGSNPLGPDMCLLLGGSLSQCYGSGFGETINPNSEKTLQLILRTNNNPVNESTITLYGETVDSPCGDGGSCEVEFAPGIQGGIPERCVIIPSSLDMKYMMTYRFDVRCYDLNNNQISCQGNSWRLRDVNGVFVERTNDHSVVGLTSQPFSTGLLSYTSGHAVCHADISVAPHPEMTCDLDPNSADLESGDTQYFNLTCKYNGNNADLNGADYWTDASLSGSLSDESTDGVDFTAGDESQGNLWAHGVYNPGNLPYVIGALARSAISVNANNNDTNNHNNTNNTGEDCLIGDTPGILETWPGFTTWLPIYCGDNFDQPCNNVRWNYQGSGVINGDDDGVRVVVSNSPGQSSMIIATINAGQNDEGYCTKPIETLTADCIEFS